MFTSFISQDDWWRYYNGSCPENITDPMGSGWVNEAFGQCIGNVRQWFAFWIGLSSIICWMLAMTIVVIWLWALLVASWQFVTNCRTGKADQVLSVWFLLQWVIGDTTNLVGAILTEQLFTQLATAVYFVLIDCVTITQYVYYLIKNQGLRGLGSCLKDKPGPQVLALFLPGVALGLLLFSKSPGLQDFSYQTNPWSARTLKQNRDIDFDDVINFNDPKDVAGYVLGCVSATFYCLSRLPQIIKNFRRCSVKGLSPLLFTLAIMGNVTYGLGIFLYSVDPVFLLQRLPWLVGSVGTLIFDFTIMIQFILSWIAICERTKSEQDPERQPLLDSKPSQEFRSSLISCCCRKTRWSESSTEYKVHYHKNQYIDSNEPEQVTVNTAKT